MLMLRKKDYIMVMVTNYFFFVIISNKDIDFFLCNCNIKRIIFFDNKSKYM